MFLQLILNIKSLVRYYCNLLYKVRKLQLFLHQALGIILLTNFDLLIKRKTEYTRQLILKTYFIKLIRPAWHLHG